MGEFFRFIKNERLNEKSVNELISSKGVRLCEFDAKKKESTVGLKNWDVRSFVIYGIDKIIDLGLENKYIYNQYIIVLFQ